MMLRSLVKKFKSHSLNEDTSITTTANNNVDGSNQPSSIDIDDNPTDRSASADGSQLTPTDNCPSFQSEWVNPAPVNHEKGTRHNDARQHCQPPGTTTTTGHIARQQQQHCLRSSSGYDCGGRPAFSIVTRLRSSALANDTSMMNDQQQRHPQCRHPICSHQRSNGSAGGQNYSSKVVGGAISGGVVMDDVCSRDSGTESDDDELEQIETNSTRSVPVSQTSDYYTSQQSLSINSCRSSHCSSPLLGLSDQECNSWESIGSESGISVQTAGGGPQQHRRRHDRQQCSRHQHKYNVRAWNANSGTKLLQLPTFGSTMIAAATLCPPPDVVMTEELPQHHYHTRQQFQRLTQQISKENGLFSMMQDSHNTDHSIPADAPNTITTDTVQQPTTAFVPVHRQDTITTTATAVDGSPEGAGGGSSLDEMEEVNFGGANLQQRPSRRPRLQTYSMAEKRKSSSQMRHQQQRHSIAVISEETGNTTSTTTSCPQFPLSTTLEKRRQERPFLQAARKTPIKLLFSLDDCVVQADNDETRNRQMATIRPTSKCQRQGPASPVVGGGSAKQLRSTKRRSQTAGGNSGDEGGNKSSEEEKQPSRRRYCKEKRPVDGSEEDGDANLPAAKRPSLDFDKMRGKLVGIVQSTQKIAKRSDKRTKCARSKVIQGTGCRQEGYQLRSTYRRCMFRPLELPTATKGDVDMPDKEPFQFTCASSQSPPHPQEFREQSQQGTSCSGADTV